MKKLLVVISLVMFAGFAHAVNGTTEDLSYDAGSLLDHLNKSNGSGMAAPKGYTSGTVYIAFDAGALLDHLRRTATQRNKPFLMA